MVQLEAMRHLTTHCAVIISHMQPRTVVYILILLLILHYSFFISKGFEGETLLKKYSTYTSFANRPGEQFLILIYRCLH